MRHADDPDYHAVSDPDPPQTPESNDADNGRPRLSLPVFTYFCIVPLLWYASVMLLLETVRQDPAQQTFELPPRDLGGPTFVLVLVLASCFVGIPIAFRVFQACALLVSRKAPVGLWMLSFLVFPKDRFPTYSWFAPIYYGSLLATALFLICFIMVPMAPHLR